MKILELKRKANLIYREHCPRGAVDIAACYKAGMIPQEKLVHGKVYVGYCRNADEALWQQDIKSFVYLRGKFGDIFDEMIPSPEDDNGFDVFVPVAEVL